MCETIEDFTRVQIMPRSHCDCFLIGSCNGLVCVVHVHEVKIQQVEGFELESVISLFLDVDGVENALEVVAKVYSPL
ncbi:unnamed protein product [Sphenostylis stenocarpa]|uniref:Uncharacterized protein n=1 Tax=Sphenostylis stenocarpa TaxID=92480 RepID=A0AA86RLL8_9FABA|nr:unnamed protein product [Sphenostylis stenocarpa]